MRHETIDRHETKALALIEAGESKRLRDAARVMLRLANKRGEAGSAPCVVYMFRAMGVALTVAAGIADLRAHGVTDPSAIDVGEVCDLFGEAHCYLIEAGVTR